MRRTTITGKGQITIPAEIREQYKLKNGDVLEFIPSGEELKIRLIRRHGASELRGLLRSDKRFLSQEEERKVAARVLAEKYR